MDKMVIVDGNSLMHRAYHALPMMTASDGTYTGALFGFFQAFLKALETETPRYAAVAFDVHAPTFRKEKYDAYKAGRPPMPDELRSQMTCVKEILRDMHVRVLELPGYEADDLLGTMSKKCEDMDVEAVLVTGDRDAFQLVSDKVTIQYLNKSDLDKIDRAAIMNLWGVEPIQLIDVKGLMGDASDNIPGVAGIGEKTAKKLIADYGTLENALDKAAEQKGKLRERLETGRDAAVFSKWLATIVRDAPIDVTVGECEIRDLTDAVPILNRLQMGQAVKRVEKIAAERAPRRETVPMDARDSFTDPEAFAERVKGFDLTEVALCLDDSLHVATAAGERARLRIGTDIIEAGATTEEAARAASFLCENAENISVYDVKSLLHLGFPLKENAFDVMLAAYVLSPQRKSFSRAALCEERALTDDGESCARALLELARAQKAEIEADGLARVLYGIDLPLARVLCDMETRGAYTDRDALFELGAQYDERIKELLARIAEIAGGALNPNSPKQLSVYLFETLGLTGGRKTKTGYSTDVEALEAIQDQHPVIPLILEYRKYAKLKSTYIDALLRKRESDGRVRTSFDQVATATGRLSSLEPNLQNIPVRTPLGRDIRKAFVAPEGWVLVDADYSQIELRVLAALSGDERMIGAFQKGEDIHAATAAEVYDVPPEFVTREMRSSAKAVNFGVVYGISDFGLAKNIGVSRQEAASFIERYFLRYPRVKAYMDERVEEGKAKGYVTTPLGRRRYLPELADRSYTMRQFGERAAMNSPIQGAAADLIKLAMIEVSRALADDGYKARLILQVHDELIVEAPEAEREKVETLMKTCMERVGDGLGAPIVAEVASGKSWYDCK